ncbi:MAG: LCP family protein [Bacillaceae bacterium]
MKRNYFIFLFIFVFIISGCTKENKEPPHIQKQETAFSGVKSKDGKINILIVGIDSRGEKSSRSDSIMIAQYDQKRQTVQVASIMRDSFVFIPTYKHGYHKINTAYFLGGPELLRKTIKENFHIDVEHYMAIDFDAFIKIVDLIAPEGIEVDIKQNIIEDMGLNLQPGIQRLHGKELLAYARFRHDNESDFGRVRRQQEILNALKDEFTSQTNHINGILQLTKTGQELLKYVDTDMNIGTILSLSGDVLLNQVKSIHTIRIPIKNSFEDKTYDYAGRVLDLDINKNRDALKQFFDGGSETKIEERNN